LVELVVELFAGSGVQVVAFGRLAVVFELVGLVVELTFELLLQLTLPILLG
jgi:hypothetical protein